MPSKNLKDKYLPIISSKWINNESYDTLMSVIWQYVDEVLESKDLNPNKNPHFGLKLANDFEKEVYDYLYLLKKGNWTRRRAADENYKLHWLEYEVQFLAFYEVRKRLYGLIDLWITEEFENKKVLKKDGLAGLAHDGQNVHTQAVVNQTNDGITIIRKTLIPKGQKTLDEIFNAWISLFPECIELISPVYEDMQKWGNCQTVIKKGDFEYRKTLRGIWAKIKTYEGDIRLELTKRLWEECYESVGMCAQGHLSRLANVLVGFDETIKPPSSTKQYFQEQIASLSRKNLPTEEKIRLATELMDEVELPQDERTPWLEAF
jgi:hypothetical protein